MGQGQLSCMYYKVGQVFLLQRGKAFLYYKAGQLLSQSRADNTMQCTFYYKVGQILQIGANCFTKCDNN